MIDSNSITGVVLAGGRGSRMGGVDKGLQNFNGLPLAQHALLRLQPQVGHGLVSANRNLATYAAFGAPVCPDGMADYAGPLAGFLAALEHCNTPWLATVPCDSPLFPTNLVARLAAAAEREQAEIAMVTAPEEDGQLRTQPVFCLLQTGLREDLLHFTRQGGRRIGAWAARHRQVLVPFDQPGDDPRAFFNANTLAELHRLEQA